jgi:Ca2+-binding RTX toxin-like protein
MPEYIGDSQDNVINGGSQNDVIRGGGGNDSLSGGTGDDTIFGGNGNDTIRGGVGHDALNGGYGNDRLVGATGVNTYVGGPGQDRFVFYTGTSEIGKIYDYLPTVEGDIIEINGRSFGIESDLDKGYFRIDITTYENNSNVHVDFFRGSGDTNPVRSFWLPQ